MKKIVKIDNVGKDGKKFKKTDKYVEWWGN